MVCLDALYYSFINLYYIEIILMRSAEFRWKSYLSFFNSFSQYFTHPADRMPLCSVDSGCADVEQVFGQLQLFGSPLKCKNVHNYKVANAVFSKINRFTALRNIFNVLKPKSPPGLFGFSGLRLF